VVHCRILFEVTKTAVVNYICLHGKERKEKERKEKEEVAAYTRCFSRAFRIWFEANPLDSRNLVSFLCSFEP